METTAAPADVDGAIDAKAAAFKDAFAQVRGEIGKVIVGHDTIVERVLICLIARGHALL